MSTFQLCVPLISVNEFFPFNTYAAFTTSRFFSEVESRRCFVTEIWLAATKLFVENKIVIIFCVCVHVQSYENLRWPKKLGCIKFELKQFIAS